MTEDEIQTLVDALGNISAVLASVDPEDKAEVYRQLGTSSPTTRPTGSFAPKPVVKPQPWGYGSVRGGTWPACPRSRSVPICGYRDGLA